MVRPIMVANAHALAVVPKRTTELARIGIGRNGSRTCMTRQAKPIVRRMEALNRLTMGGDTQA